MLQKLAWKAMFAKESAKDALKTAVCRVLCDEKGDTNIIAILLLIVVVIGLVAVFKDRMVQLVNNLFDKIGTNANNVAS